MILQFEPFTTVIGQAFWVALTKRKLEVGLDETEISIHGHFELGSKLDHESPLPARFFLDESSLDSSELPAGKNRVELHGLLKLFNTMDSFKQFDKLAWLNGQAAACKVDFFLIAFADLKKYRYYYHACYPSPFYASASIKAEFEKSDKIYTLAEGQVFAKEGPTLVVADSSCRPNVVGWHIRRVLIEDKSIQQVICLRKDPDDNLAFRVTNMGELTDLRMSGWERNQATGKIGHKMVDLSTSMDPIKLAEEAAELNLKLIKWRLLPNLNLDIFSTAKCLLVGAGTLGCNVTRILLAWGVRDITLIDNGKVSFSNPVRQPLFLQEDCLDGGRPKAETAAKRAMEVCPFARISGHQLAIPMPGHLINDESDFLRSCEQLESLVGSHDVIFLLTDSRESRWMPAILGAALNKIVITVALGFDSFVAMRHGSSESDLGCYFCTDVNSPTDTLSGRTLDQQCTVTRPGLSYMAAATAVELLASILQHPKRNNAPTSPATAPTQSLPHGSSMLGMVPHQIRGFLTHFQNLILKGEKFECCPACSPRVIEAFKSNGIEFLRRAVSDVDYLDLVTGLADLRTAEQLKMDAFLEDLSDDNDF